MAKQKVTISDVARVAGVSAQTVSRVVNRKGEISAQTRQLVRKVIKDLGYRPSSIARSLATNKTYTIGLVVPDIANPFFPEIARGIEDFAWENNYGVLLCNTLEDMQREEAAIRSLEDKRVDGIILCSSRLSDEDLFELIESHQAAVLVNRSVPDDLAATVRVDDVYGASLAVQHLIDCGRDVIGFLSGPTTSQSGRERIEGARNTLRQAGIEDAPSLSLPCAPNASGGYRTAQELLARRPDVQALVCYNDMVAVGALQACAERGLSVPDDVAIVGYDDSTLAELVQPSLTTLRVPKYDIGADAARILLDRIQGQKGQREVLHRPELIVRRSTPELKNKT